MKTFKEFFTEGLVETLTGVAKGVKPWTGGNITDIELKRAVSELDLMAQIKIYQDVKKGAGDEDIAVLVKELWKNSSPLAPSGKLFENGQMVIYALENQPGTAQKIVNYLNSNTKFLHSLKLYKNNWKPSKSSLS